MDRYQCLGLECGAREWKLQSEEGVVAGPLQRSCAASPLHETSFKAHPRRLDGRGYTVHYHHE